MERLLRYGQGETLSYAEYGSESGYPVLVQHGMVASVSLCGPFARLADAGFRLVCMARPGYGESSPRELECVGEWGDLAALLADELGLERFDVLGTSSGAPYAYAIAARSPRRAREVFIFSGTPALCDPGIEALWPFPLNRSATIDWARGIAREVFFSGVDPESLTGSDPWSADLRDSMAHDCFGPALDLKIRCLDWGFRLGDVAQRVHMQHSRDDESVPFAAAEATARLLPGCELDVRAAGGHFSPELMDAFIERTMLPALRREGGR